MRKIVILTPETKKESWLEDAKAKYLEKMRRFHPVDWQNVKTPKADRDQYERKIADESQGLLKAIAPEDFVVLLDERGKQLDSIQFSKVIQQNALEASTGRMIFIIGGAFGVSDEIMKRAQIKISLSQLVFAHPIAQLVLLEQIYRGFTILRGLPYHNS